MKGERKMDKCTDHLYTDHLYMYIHVYTCTYVIIEHHSEEIEMAHNSLNSNNCLSGLEKNFKIMHLPQKYIEYMYIRQPQWLENHA